MNSAQILDRLFENALVPGWYEVLRKKGGFLGGKFSDDAYFDGSRWLDKAQQPVSNVIQVGGPAQGPPPVPQAQPPPVPRTAQPPVPRSPIQMSPSLVAQAQGNPSPATVAAANTVLPAPPAATPPPAAAPAASAAATPPTPGLPSMPVATNPVSRPGWYQVHRKNRTNDKLYLANCYSDGGGQWYDRDSKPVEAPSIIGKPAGDPRRRP